MKKWYDDDAFWETLEGPLFDQVRMQAAPDEAAQAALLLGLSPGASVLDLCCGTGRHSLELARRGYRVTGVDRTASYLARVRQCAAAANLSIELVQDDMRTFRRPEAFDGAINLYTSFGYFDDPAEDLQVLQNLHASLRPGARLVMQTAGKEVLARRFTAKDWLEYPDGSFLLAHRHVGPEWSRLSNRWILIGGERKVIEFSHRVYSAAELRASLAAAGFRAVEIYGDFDRRPYNQDANYLLAVAEP